MKKYLLTALISFIAGSIIFFFVGRSTIKTETEISYVTGETVSGSVSNNQFEPVKEEKPDKPLLPTKEIEIQYIDTGSVRTITETKYLYQVVDTAAIIEDYILKRSYSITAFDNKEIGKLELFPTLQYNDLVKFDYSFTPIQQRMMIKPKFTPFFSASYYSLNYVGLGGGFFYHNLGLEYQYMIGYNNNKNAHTFGLNYKF